MNLSLAGQSIGIGVIVSLATQWLKANWIPPQFKTPLVLRVFVAVICVVLTSADAFLTGQPLSATLVINAFISYLSAAATYDHLPEATAPAGQ